MKNGRMHPKKSRCLTSLRINALLFCGICLVAVGAVFPVFWPQYYENVIANELKMTPESKTFQVWKDNPVPIYIEFFFFNWTNRDSLEAEGEMHIPQLQELGPYRFTERIERENISWHENNTLTYKQAKYWYFDAENSKGTLDDVITTLNVVALTAAFTARDWSFITKASVASAFSLTKQEIHVKRPVRELLFEGYSDNLISMARSMPSFAGVKVPFDKFGWFYKRNGTSFMDGVFNMNTGMDNIQALGKLEFWNYRTTTDYFQGECAEVRGTTGQLFPPGQSRERSVQMFSPDLCRSISFEYGEDTVVNDVPGYKYQGGLDVLDNGTLFPSNKCYCNGECVPSGVVNVTSCRFGAPAFASFPHFYSADPFFSDNVRGMKPIKEKHQFYLVLEPTTGIPLDVAARFQINLLLQPLQGMRLYESVPTLFFPMIWFQQRATIPSDMAFSLRVLLFLRHFGIIMAIASSLSGCLLLGYSMFLCGRINRTQTMQLDDNKDDINMYVAAMESPKLEKNSSHQYIVMKPKNEIVKTNKL